jgi:TolA-binding protein
MLPLQAGEIRQDLGLAHAARHVFENVVNRDPGAADARLATPNIRVDDNVLLEVVHR